MGLAKFHILQESKALKPVVIVEVKHSVGADIKSLVHKQLGQTFVQAYYAIESYKVDFVLATLTDGTSWHIWKLAKAPVVGEPTLSPVLAVLWYTSFIKDASALANFMASYLKQ